MKEEIRHQKEMMEECNYEKELIENENEGINIENFDLKVDNKRLKQT